MCTQHARSEGACRGNTATVLGAMAMRIMARGALSQTCAAAESAKAAAHAHGLVNTRMGKEKK